LISTILIVSGAITAIAGLPAIFVPRVLLRIVFGVTTTDAAIRFFVRHWGVLISAVGLLLVACAFTPAARPPILIAAATEKLAIVTLIFFGPLSRTALMTVAALVNGALALIYIAYLVGGSALTMP
jgi:hypothetical protein